MHGVYVFVSAQHSQCEKASSGFVHTWGCCGVVNVRQSFVEIFQQPLTHVPWKKPRKCKIILGQT